MPKNPFWFDKGETKMADNDYDSAEDVAATKKRLKLLQLKYTPEARETTDKLRIQNQMRLRDKAKKRVQEPQEDGTQGTDVPLGSIGSRTRPNR